MTVAIIIMWLLTESNNIGIGLSSFKYFRVNFITNKANNSLLTQPRPAFHRGFSQPVVETEVFNAVRCGFAKVKLQIKTAANGSVVSSGTVAYNCNRQSLLKHV